MAGRPQPVPAQRPWRLWARPQSRPRWGDGLGEARCCLGGWADAARGGAGAGVVPFGLALGRPLAWAGAGAAAVHVPGPHPRVTGCAAWPGTMNSTALASAAAPTPAPSAVYHWCLPRAPSHRPRSAGRWRVVLLAGRVSVRMHPPDAIKAGSVTVATPQPAKTAKPDNKGRYGVPPKPIHPGYGACPILDAAVTKTSAWQPDQERIEERQRMEDRQD